MRGAEQNRDLPQSGADLAWPSGSEGGSRAAATQAVGGCGGRTEATVGQILELLCGIDTLSKCDEKSLDRWHGCIRVINVSERCSLLCGEEPVFKKNGSKEVVRRQLALHCPAGAAGGLSLPCPLLALCLSKVVGGAPLEGQTLLEKQTLPAPAATVERAEVVKPCAPAAGLSPRQRSKRLLNLILCPDFTCLGWISVCLVLSGLETLCKESLP